MQVKIEVSADRIAQLFASAIEGGDPVTTASRGGWCSGIDLKSASFDIGSLPKEPATTTAWWTMPEFFETGADITIEIAEVDDESTGHETTHTIKRADIARGLEVMAAKYPHRFTQLLTDEQDAPCADAFLQSMLFGDEKYA